MGLVRGGSAAHIGGRGFRWRVWLSGKMFISCYGGSYNETILGHGGGQFS